jgi:hypothetical protein
MDDDRQMSFGDLEKMRKRRLRLPKSGRTEGRRLAREGAELAEDNANKAEEGWSEKAEAALLVYRDFLGRNKRFMCEDFRHWAIDNGILPEPPNNKAFGGVMTRARKRGVVVRGPGDYSKDPKSHSAPSNDWLFV